MRAAEHACVWRVIHTAAARAQGARIVEAPPVPNGVTRRTRTEYRLDCCLELVRWTLEYGGRIVR